MLHIITFKWGKKYLPLHVNILKRSVKKNLKTEHKFVCITDNPGGLDDDITVMNLWDDFRELKKCYTRIKIFDSEISSLFDNDFLMLDLDTVISGDITEIVNIPESFIWKTKSTSPGKKDFVYNPSVTRVNDDKFIEVWEKFNSNPQKYIHKVNNTEKWSGSDQGVISYLLHNKIKTIGTEEGVISFRDNPELFNNESLSSDVRIVGFYGKENNPIIFDLQEKYIWIKKHWLSYATEKERISLNKNKLGNKTKRVKRVKRLIRYI